MKFRSFVLEGAAIVGLAATALPATAYTHHPSTPVEQKQTDDLNTQALAKAQGQQQTASADQGMPSTQAQTRTANDQAAQMPGGSNDQTATNTAVEGSRTVAAEGQSQTVAPAATASSGATAAVSLAQIANPPQTLVNASVETANGQAVGAVQKVVTDDSGRAQAVSVALLGAQSKIVSIDASQLSYDQSRNVVVAQLSADQIQALPATPQG